MIRPLHPTDVVRYALFSRLGRANRVRVLDDLVQGGMSSLTLRRVCLKALSIPKGERCLVSTSGKDLLALACIRQRSGPGAWEISHLSLSLTGTEDCTELLEELCRLAAQLGAERVFLRILDNDPLAENIKRAGFFPYYLNLEYRGHPKHSPIESVSPLPLRLRTPGDDLGLFRLYNAAVPHKVRTAIGLTMDQWRDSQEKRCGTCIEMVYENRSSICGWLQTTQEPKFGRLEVLAHPDEEGILGALVDQGIRHIGSQRTICAIVSDYQGHLGRLLVEMGLEKTSEYLVMVKFMAVRAESKSVAPTKAAPIRG